MDPLTMAALGMGIFQMGQGVVQKIKAKDMASKNVFVPRRTAQGVTDNLALAENRASQGLSSGAKNAYIQNADRGLSSSIDAILRSGSGNNMLGDLNDNYNQGISRLAFAEDEANVRNLDNYMKANYANAQEDNTNWEVNSYAQWANKAQAATSLAQQGASNISGGVNTAFSGLASMKQGQTNPMAGLNSRSVSPTTYMVSNTPQTVRYSDRSAINLSALGLRPLTTNFPTSDVGPQMPANWGATSQGPYVNPYMWDGMNIN